MRDYLLGLLGLFVAAAVYGAGEDFGRRAIERRTRDPEPPEDPPTAVFTCPACKGAGGVECRPRRDA